MRYLFVALLALLLPPLATADIYRWTDENGTISYGQTPPPGVSAERIPRAAGPASLPASGTNTPAQIRSYLDKSKKTARPRKAATARRTADVKPPPQAKHLPQKSRKKNQHWHKREIRSLDEQKAAFRNRELNPVGEELRNKPDSLSKKQADRAARR